MVFSFALFAKLLGARNRGRARADMPVPKAPALQAKTDFQIRICARRWHQGCKDETETSVRRRF